MIRDRYRKMLEKEVRKQKEGDKGVIGIPAVKSISKILLDYAQEERDSQKKYDKLANRLDALQQYKTSKVIRLIAETEKAHAEILTEIARQLRIQLW